MVMRIFRLRFNLKAYFLAFVARVCQCHIRVPCRLRSMPRHAAAAQGKRRRAAARQHTTRHSTRTIGQRSSMTSSAADLCCPTCAVPVTMIARWSS